MKKLAFFGIVIMGLIVIGSCVKKEDTIAKIEVRDENNDVVEQAMVVLHGTSTCNCPSQVAVWDINAYKANRFGQGIIKIEAEMTNEETVIIQP